jgi:alkanesulfonate monooxygenase SsuD/methylene tetrahydromethanopterin reductase-like flavin-dependent oxidoreductase (luciferase family)
MKFAHFSHIWAKPGMTPHQRYEELWRELQLCDELGFDYGFCVEHHFRPDESWMSSPSLYAVGAGARTRRLRVGPMGYIVPLYHPLRLAEEIAIVDQMLGGRMELGLVPGFARSGSIMISASRRRSNLSITCVWLRRDAAVLFPRKRFPYRKRRDFGATIPASASAAMDDEP